MWLQTVSDSFAYCNNTSKDNKSGAYTYTVHRWRVNWTCAIALSQYYPVVISGEPPRKHTLHYHSPSCIRRAIHCEWKLSIQIQKQEKWFLCKGRKEQLLRVNYSSCSADLQRMISSNRSPLDTDVDSFVNSMGVKLDYLIESECIIIIIMINVQGHWHYSFDLSLFMSITTDLIPAHHGTTRDTIIVLVLSTH